MTKLRKSVRDESCVACGTDDGRVVFQLKHCRRCGTDKPLEDFSAHAGSPDGRYSLCRPCKSLKAKAYYANNRAAVVERVRDYQNTPTGRAKLREKIHAYWRRHPEKRKAHDIVRDAVKHGRLTKQPCEKCGRNAEAHHDDYSKPLDVRWLCRFHHREFHREQESKIA